MIRRLLLLALLPTTALAGNGLFPIADGPAQRGRGGTVLAIAEDAFSINSNPAGLAFISDRQIDVALTFFFQRLTFEDPIQPEGVDGVESIPLTQPIGPSFGVAFDRISDLTGLFSAGWSQLRHGGPRGEVPSTDLPAQGQLAWNVTGAPPADVKLMASGLEATVSEAKLYGFFREGSDEAEAWTILERKSLPSVPEGATVIGVGVDFLWKYTARLGAAPPRARLEVDGRSVTRDLHELGQRWTRAATSLLLDQQQLPGRVAFRVEHQGNALGFARVRLRVGYKLRGRYHWIRVDLPGPTRAGPRIHVALLTGSEEPRPVDGMGPRVIHSFRMVPEPEVPEGSRLVRLALRYRYRYQPSKSVANLLHMRALADGVEAAHTSHSMTERPRRNLPPMDAELRGPLPPPERHDKLKFGIGFFAQGGAGIKIDIKTDLFPDGLENKSDLLFLSLAPSVAWRPTKNFAVGASLLANFARMELDGLISEPLSRLNGQALSGIRFSSVFRALSPFDQLRGSIDMEPATTYGFGGKFGLMWKLTKNLTFGANYATRSYNQKFKTTAEVDFTQIFDASGLLLTLPALIFLPNGGLKGLRSKFDMEVDFQLPQHAGVGLAWKAKPWLRLSADARWIDWSDTMNEVEVELTNGSNPDVAALVGSRDINTSFRIGWQDMYVLALGAEFYVGKHWILRLGYNANSNPLSDDRFTSPQIPALTVEHITAGFSYLGERTDVHFGYSYGLLNRSREENGESFVSADFDFVDVAFGPQHVLAIGITWRY